MKTLSSLKPLRAVNTDPEFLSLSVSFIKTSDIMISMKLEITMTASKMLNQSPLKYILNPMDSILSTISIAKIHAKRRFNFSRTVVDAVLNRLEIEQVETDSPSANEYFSELLKQPDIRIDMNEIHRNALSLKTRPLDEVLNDPIWEKLFNTFDSPQSAWVECEQKCNCNLVDQEYAIGWLTN